MAGALEQPARLSRDGGDAETRICDRPARKAAALEVSARGSAAFARQLATAQVEELAEQIGAPVARLGTVDRRRVDAGSLGDLSHRADEVGAVRDGAAVDVGGPEQRLAAVNEKAAWCRPVRDDALGAHAKTACVCCSLVATQPRARGASRTRGRRARVLRMGSSSTSRG